MKNSMNGTGRIGTGVGRGVVAASIVSFVAASGVSAATVEIASNLGPGDAYNTVSSFLVLGPNEISIGNIDQAVPFTTGVDPVFATGVDLALRLNAGFDGVAVSIYSSVGGLPGAALVSTALAGLPLGGDGAIVSATFGAPLLLSANTSYWVVADAGFDTDISWKVNSTGMVSKAGRAGWPVGPWNFNPDADTPAFRVVGTAIPGPGTLAVLAGLGVGVAGRRRSERSAA